MRNTTLNSKPGRDSLPYASVLHNCVLQNQNSSGCSEREAGPETGCALQQGQHRTRQRPDHTLNGYGVLFWSDGLEPDRGCR